MTLPIFRLECTVSLRRRRLLLLNVGTPLTLVIPVALGGAPPHHAAAVYSILFVLFGTMGSAIPILRDGERGFLARIQQTGYPPWRFLLERILAGTLVDLGQLTPALLAAVMLTRGAPTPSPADLPHLAVVLGVALLAANLVGVWVASLARSLAEGALFGAVATLFLLHFSGVFRTPMPGSGLELLSSVLPFRPLHLAVQHSIGVPVPNAPPDLLLFPPALPTGTTLLAVLASLFLAPLLLTALSRVKGH